MRVRIRELLRRHKMTPYALAKAAKGRVSLSTVYRLNRLDGRLKLLDADVLDTLCDVFDVGPGTLLERGGKKKRRRS